MKKSLLLLVMLTLLLISGTSFSQSWVPEPVNSPYINAMEGTWTSAPYEFMGNTNTDVVTSKKILNGQFMELDIKRIGDNFTYEGKEILVANQDGTITGYFFDNIGTRESSTYNGRTEGGKLILNSSSLMGKGTREIIIDGNNMIQNTSFVMTRDGKNSPEQKITTTYTKGN